MKHLRSHPHLWSLVALLAVDGLFFGLTDPQNVPSWLLMAGFLLFVSTIYYFVKAVLVVLSWYGLPTLRHKRRLTLSLTIVIGIFLALQSLGELGSRDVIVMVPFTWLSYLYFAYNRSPKSADVSA
jgi:hypothetical protein